MRVALIAAAALIALSGCAPQITEGLPDEPKSEQVDAAPDKASDPRQGVSFTADATASADSDPAMSADDQAAILARHPGLDPQGLVSKKLLARALQYYELHSASIANKDYLSVVDFSLPSMQRRFFIVSLQTGIVFPTTVAHGKNSDRNNDGYADTFSNTENSEMSSLGIYKTAETYSGEHGLSLRLDGMSSTNSNVRTRAVVVHGADYVLDETRKQGRSWGCLAIPMNYRDKLIPMLKNGSVIYAGQSL